MLEIKNVTKRYKDLLANNNISTRIEKNQITILLGENGAGKSTLIKSIVGFLKFEGEIIVDGIPNKELAAKTKIGYVPEIASLYNELTVMQQFQFVAYAYGIKNFEETAEYYLNRFRIYDKKDSLCGTLSKGMRQKVSIICALILKPEILILDEPLIGLDPEAIRDLRTILEEKKEMMGILLSTHIIETIATIWDKVIILNKGSLVFEATRKEFENSNQTLEEVYFAKKGL